MDRSGKMAEMTLDDVMSRRSEILELARARKARRVRLFGSVVKGESGPDSDVDFLVDFETGASALDQVGLVRDLKKLLGVEVEVVSAGGLEERHERIPREAIDL
jgi:hypothetical protein